MAKLFGDIWLNLYCKWDNRDDLHAGSFFESTLNDNL